MPPGELAVAQRVQQLQALIEQTRSVAATALARGCERFNRKRRPPPRSTSFADALQAATQRIRRDARGGRRCGNRANTKR